MSQLMQPFNPLQFDPTQSAGQLPIGKHPVIIESDEVKANSKNDGGFLQLNLRVIEGPNAGATGPYRLNLYNNSQQAVEIAHKQLSAICHVVKVFQLGASGNDTSVLHNIPFIVEVGPQKADPQYTEIKKVYDIQGNEPGKGQQQTTAPAQVQQPQQQAAATGGAQWAAGGQQQQQPAQTGTPAWAAQPQQPPPQQPQSTTGPAWQQNSGQQAIGGTAPRGQK